MKNISVVVVDDHPLFLDGVVKCLDSEPDISVVGQGASAADALRITIETLPDVILLDVNMPGDGISAAENISQACPVVRIGMLTMSEHDDDVVRSLQAGAHGYVLKGISGSELTEVVKTLHAGELYVSPGLAAQLLFESRSRDNSEPPKSVFSGNELTVREEQILEGISEGLSNKEIGMKLHIAEKTVKNYVTNVLQKLQVRNRVEAAILAKDGSKSRKL